MNTYPAMNAKIVDLLRLREDPTSLYAAARIEELEKALDRAAKYIYDCVAEECPPGPVCEKPCAVGEFVDCWKKYFLEDDSDA